MLAMSSCAGGGGGKEIGGKGNESSKPINRTEEIQYKQALIRCYKTGGSRIVKITGVLRCY